ncbi:hypothetical protein JNW88_30995, partial [Micromonospora sp. ATA32]|nr:hypothetical protein [Micromonospora sp. ATA32]
DLTGMPGLAGSLGAALVGAATALTISHSRTIRTLTTPVDLTGMPGLAGSLGAALVGAATALTISHSRTIRTITAPGLAIGYALVFTYNTNSALIVGYLIALTWWGIRLTAQTLRLAFPDVGAALHRLIDRSDG